VTNLTGHPAFIVGSTGNATQFIVDVNGNVGVGTTTPSALLDVYKSTNGPGLFVEAGVAGTNIAQFSRRNGASADIIFGAASGDPNITFTTNAASQFNLGYDVSAGVFSIASGNTLGTADRFVIDSLGRIGIGTTTPRAGQQGDLVGHSKDRKSKHAYGDMKAARNAIARGDLGSAARFFYCAKADAEDRGVGNNHPTVKPLALMRYLCRLVTPPGGTILDPFMGSGSTGKACAIEEFSFVGIERDPEYFELAGRRIGDTSPLTYQVEVQP
jgi:hypothetical protein